MNNKRQTKKSKRVEESQENKIELIKYIKPKTKGQYNYYKAIENNRIILVSGPAGTGKAQPLTSIIWTPSGPVKMGEIKLKDEILTPNGDRAKVLGIYPQGKKKIYKITFSDGSETECCEEHLWTVYSEDWKDSKTLELKEIINIFKRPSGRRKLYVQKNKPVDFNKQEIEINPYILGCLIGDGGLYKNQIMLSSKDKEIISYFTEEMQNIGCVLKQQTKIDFRINKSYLKLRPILSKMGLLDKLSYNKFIPKHYLYNSYENRLSLLQGLLDTDGSASSGAIEFSTTSKQLSEDVKTLVQSLGGIARIVERMGSYTLNNIKKQTTLNYRVYIRFDNDLIPFRLKRKINQLKIKTKFFIKRYIENIEYIGEKEAQCIYIDSNDHLYLTDNFIPTHNTSLSCYYAAKSLIANKYRKVIITRPAIEACNENFGFLKGDIDSKIYPYLVPIYEELEKYVDKQIVQRWKAEKIIEIAPLAFMRGRNLESCFIIADECQNMSREQFKMILTRMHDDSKIVLCGDFEQSDLKNKGNDFKNVCERLDGMESTEYVRLTDDDIVRSRFISEILDRLK